MNTLDTLFAIVSLIPIKSTHPAKYVIFDLYNSVDLKSKEDIYAGMYEILYSIGIVEEPWLEEAAKLFNDIKLSA